MLAHLPDGSYLSDLDGLAVRIIDAELTVTGADGSRVRDRYRLVTTLLDHDHHPAAELIRLYHERWEIEIAYLALRHTLLDGHVLRSQDRAGLEQEVWALLTLYQLLRMAMVTAVETRPGTDPDRASFTTALQTARDQLVAAAGIVCPTDAARPPRRHRPRRPGHACCHPADPAAAPARSRTPPPATSTATTAGHDLPTTITASTSPCTHPPSTRRGDPGTRKPTRPDTRPHPTRDQVTALMQDDPSRPWPGRELADKLGIKPRNMLTQLAEWTRLGFLTRTGAGTYHLPTRRDAQSP